MIVLRKRLQVVLELLQGAQVVADIGCDHGRLDAALLQRGVAKRVIASDISDDSLSKARELKARLSLGNELSLRVGDGLFALEGEAVDAIAICGMGGELMARILAEGEYQARRAGRIIMQPMRGCAQLRQFLRKNGYNIFDERLVRDNGRIYQIIAAKSGIQEPIPKGWPEGLYELGWVMYNRGEELLPGLIQARLDMTEKKILAGARELAKIHDQLARLKALMEDGTLHPRI